LLTPSLSLWERAREKEHSEMMVENRKERDRGLYYFSRVQLVLLAVGFTIASVVIFFLGIMIGQGIEERKLLKKEGPLVKIPVKPPTRGSSGAPAAREKEEMTFYDTLAKVPTGSQPPRPVFDPEAQTRRDATKEAKPVEKAVKPPVKETKAESPASAQKAQEQAEAEVKQAIWTVQVNAFPDEKPAQGLVKKLKDKGYDAYMVTRNIAGKTWYRVRVGSFATREEARELQEVLKSKENFAKAIAVSR